MRHLYLHGSHYIADVTTSTTDGTQDVTEVFRQVDVEAPPGRPRDCTELCRRNHTVVFRFLFCFCSSVDLHSVLVVVLGSERSSALPESRVILRPAPIGSSDFHSGAFGVRRKIKVLHSSFLRRAELQHAQFPGLGFGLCVMSLCAIQCFHSKLRHSSES